MAGTSSTLFSERLFSRQLKFGENWLHIIFQWIVLEIWRELANIIFRQIVLEAAQIWRELAPHYFLTDCFGGSSNFAGTGSIFFPTDCFGGISHYFLTDCFGGSPNLKETCSTLFYGGLFWKFGGNWLHIIFQ